jgi:hypothetical protein
MKINGKGSGGGVVIRGVRGGRRTITGGHMGHRVGGLEKVGGVWTPEGVQWTSIGQILRG